MDLLNLREGLGNLSDEELQKLLLDIRQHRRVRKVSAPKAVSVKKEKDLDVAALLKTMNKEQILEMIKALGGAS